MVARVRLGIMACLHLRLRAVCSMAVAETVIHPVGVVVLRGKLAKGVLLTLLQGKGGLRTRGRAHSIGMITVLVHKVVLRLGATGVISALTSHTGTTGSAAGDGRGDVVASLEHLGSRRSRRESIIIHNHGRAAELRRVEVLYAVAIASAAL